MRGAGEGLILYFGKQNLRAKFDMILDHEESVVRNEKGEIQMHYSVHVVWTRRIAIGETGSRKAN